MPSLSSASVGLAAAAVLASLSLLFKRKGAHNRSVWALALLPIATLAILERRRLLATLWGGKPGKRGESEGTLEIKAETAPAAEQVSQGRFLPGLRQPRGLCNPVLKIISMCLIRML